MSDEDDLLEIPAFLRREPGAARKTAGQEMKPAAKKPVARQDVPRLRELGYSDEDIADMVDRAKAAGVPVLGGLEPPEDAQRSLAF